MTIAWQQHKAIPQWPDLSIDHEAWERAKQQLPNGTTSERAILAQKIKDELRSK